VTGFHAFLGFAVVALTGIAGVRGLILRKAGPTDQAIAGWALGTLVIQTASGMFLLTATSEGPGVLHIALPLAAIAAILGARAMRGDARTTAMGAAYLFAAVASLVAWLTGTFQG